MEPAPPLFKDSLASEQQETARWGQDELHRCTLGLSREPSVGSAPSPCSGHPSRTQAPPKRASGLLGFWGINPRALQNMDVSKCYSRSQQG